MCYAFNRDFYLQLESVIIFTSIKKKQYLLFILDLRVMLNIYLLFSFFLNVLLFAPSLILISLVTPVPFIYKINKPML